MTRAEKIAWDLTQPTYPTLQDRARAYAAALRREGNLRAAEVLRMRVCWLNLQIQSLRGLGQPTGPEELLRNDLLRHALELEAQA